MKYQSTKHTLVVIDDEYNNIEEPLFISDLGIAHRGWFLAGSKFVISLVNTITEEREFFPISPGDVLFCHRLCRNVMIFSVRHQVMSTVAVADIADASRSERPSIIPIGSGGVAFSFKRKS